MASVNAILKDMRKQGKLKDMKAKGDAGEDAVLQLVLERKRQTGGLVFQSYRYPYQQNRQGVTYLGNIKLEGDQFVEYTDARNGRILEDEIDILYITPYRIIPIEVKSYHAKLLLKDSWMWKQGTPVDKSPVAQAEKHARHLYHALYDVIPDGRPEYIRPIACFVDRCTLIDERTDDEINYLPCCILNNLKSTLVQVNTPLRYNLDLDTILLKLKEVQTDVKREYT